MTTFRWMLLQSAQFDRLVSVATGSGGLVADRRIAVCGTHRSGTTLLGDLLSADPRTAQLFEPFSPLSGIACVDRWYASADRPGSPWRQVIDDYIAGQNTKWRTRRGETPNLARWFKGTPMLREYVAARVRRPHRIVVKCPYLTLSAQYLIERHDFRVLFTVRHPGAFLASLRRVQWDAAVWLDDLVEQGSCSREERAMATTQAAQAGLLWRIVNRHALETQRLFPDSAVLLSHEDFCADPHGEMARVTQGLGIDYSLKMQKAVSHATAGDVVIPPEGEVELLVRNASAMVGEWRNR
ncbi:hypothetical protein DBR17_15625, partial [Sphingomonas sp. HMWF008]